MKDNWCSCGECGSEFKVITSIDEGDVEWCPFCGAEMYEDTDDDDYDIDDGFDDA